MLLCYTLPCLGYLFTGLSKSLVWLALSRIPNGKPFYQLHGQFQNVCKMKGHFAISGKVNTQYVVEMEYYYKPLTAMGIMV